MLRHDAGGPEKHPENHSGKLLQLAIRQPRAEVWDSETSW